MVRKKNTVVYSLIILKFTSVGPKNDLKIYSARFVHASNVNLIGSNWAPRKKVCTFLLIYGQ